MGVGMCLLVHPKRLRLQAAPSAARDGLSLPALHPGRGCGGFPVGSLTVTEQSFPAVVSASGLCPASHRQGDPEGILAQGRRLRCQVRDLAPYPALCQS